MERVADLQDDPGCNGKQEQRRQGCARRDQPLEARVEEQGIAQPIDAGAEQPRNDVSG